MAALLTKLIKQNVATPSSPKVLATFINSELAKAACWITQQDSQQRLQQSIEAINLLLKGLIK